MTGVPVSSATQPGATLPPMRRSRPILLPATELIEASNRKGTSLPAGAAMPIGFSPSNASAPKVGATCTPPEVMEMPIMSWGRARWAW